MKKKWMTGILAVALMALTLSTGQAQDNIVRQTDIDTGIRLDIVTPNDVGEQTALIPINGSGSEFQLWADDSGNLVFVDSKVIGPYMPKATFNVTTEDNVWVGAAVDNLNGALIPRAIYRTRVDHPYTVQVNTLGLVNVPTAPQAAKEVNYLHVGENTVRTEATPFYSMGNVANEYLINSSVLTGNGSFSSTQYSQLTGFNPSTSKVGQEHFTVRAYADLNSGTDSWRVKRATVIIWPMATGTFNVANGVDGNGLPVKVPFPADQVYSGEIPTIFVQYKDLYPESKTYIRISKEGVTLTQDEILDAMVDDGTGTGAVKFEKKGTRKSYSSSNAYAHNPSEFQITHTILQEYIDYWGNGVYTLEIITGDMPFNSQAFESVTSISFEISNSVKVRSTIGTK